MIIPLEGQRQFDVGGNYMYILKVTQQCDSRAVALAALSVAAAGHRAFISSSRASGGVAMPIAPFCIVC